VGAAAIAAFLVLLLLALMHRPAQAEPTVPVATPAATPSIQPTQPGPSQSLPADPDPSGGGGFAPDPSGRGFDPDRVPRGGGFGGAAPAPSTGGNQT
jgi:hypothetical protein